MEKPIISILAYRLKWGVGAEITEEYFEKYCKQNG